jgi:predicted helicase
MRKDEKMLVRLTDIFKVYGTGIITARDKLTLHFTREEVFSLVNMLTSIEEKIAGKIFNIRPDTRDWSIRQARQDILDNNIDKRKIVPVLYRPFDIRYTYYTGKSRGFICNPRINVMKHMLQENTGLVTVRRVDSIDTCNCFAADTIIDGRLISTAEGSAFLFPLKIYEDLKEGIYRSNIKQAFFKQLQEKFGIPIIPSSVRIFYYIYAILSSSIYLETFKKHLKKDFPLIPFISDYQLFSQLSNFGERLAGIQLMKIMPPGQSILKGPEFKGSGDNIVIMTPTFTYKTVNRGDGKVYINKSQYFSNINQRLWGYKICGHQVLKKWLKDRKGRRLSDEEIDHYIRICHALQLSAAYRRAIDVLYSQVEKLL